MWLGWCYSFSVVLYAGLNVLLHIGNRCMMVEFDAVCSAHGGSNCVATGPRSVGLFMSYVFGIKLKTTLKFTSSVREGAQGYSSCVQPRRTMWSMVLMIV